MPPPQPPSKPTHSAFEAFVGPDPSKVWPALLNPPAAAMAAMLQQLERSQWWAPDQMQSQQFHQAGALLAQSYRQLPFYRKRLDEAGYQPEQPVTPEIWSRIPLLTRQQVQASGPALYAPELPGAHGKLHELSTSGSTGRPIKARGSSVTQFFWDALTLREHLWHRRDFSLKLASIRSLPLNVGVYPEGIEQSNWSHIVKSIFGDGPAVALHIAARVDEQAEWLQRHQPSYLLTYPSALRALLIHCRDNNLALPNLRQVRTVSELLEPETRDLCREVWGVEIADSYSTQENGYLAFQCGEHDAYHVQSEAVILEILDDDLKPCRPGEVGQVVVTQLHNFAMPMLRYAVGDLAEAGKACPCGRGLPVLNRILGRTRDMLVYPDGRRAWAQFGTSRLANIPGVQQIQIVQHAVDDIEMKLVSDRVLSAEEEIQVRGWMWERSGHRFPVRFTYHEEIPRSAGGKFHDFRCEIPD